MLGLGAWSSPPAEARDSGSQHVDISAGTLPDAIAELAREARVSIGMEGSLPRVRTPRVRGSMPVSEALGRLLDGTGYAARRVGDTAWRIERLKPAAVSSRSNNPPSEAAPVPIIVTATKQPLDLLSLPAAVSVSELTDAEAHDPGSASATIAHRIEGLALTSLGAGRNRMFLHGIADSAFGGESQSTVAVVLDEARITYSAPDPDIRLIDMERVEVLKGPQGSLYGTGALGGIYRLVSHRAELDMSSLTLSGGVNGTRHGGIGHSGSAIANLPLVADAAALRLIGYGAEEAGWIDTGTRSNTNSTRISGARASLGLEPGAGWRFDLMGFGQWIEARDSSYVYARGTLSRPDQHPELHDNDLRHVAGRLAGTIGEITILLASAKTWHDVTGNLDATVGAEGFGLDDPQTLRDGRSYRIWDNDLRLRGQIGALSWLAGVSHLESQQSLMVSLKDLSGTQAIASDDRRTSRDSAAYFDLSLPVAPTLSIDGGGRLFRSSISETRTLSSGEVTREIDKSGVTPSLALAWQPDPDRLIYVRYGSAFRQGGLTIASSGSVNALKGDELASIEAGWREHLPGRRGHAEINVWYTRWEDVQADSLGSDGLITSANAGNARIMGVEGSLDIRLARGWQAEAGANFTSARLVRNALGYKLDDTRLPVVPEYDLRGALRHDFAVGRLDAWARLGLRYTGPARMSFDPELDRKMGNLLDSEFEVHLFRDAWDFSLSARNLLNRRGNVFAYGNALRYRSMQQYILQRPMSITLTASLRL